MRILTTSNVNIRSGPSMIFDTVGTANIGTEYSSYEYRKDSEGIGWYKVDEGWICGLYVTLDQTAKASDVKKMNLRQNAEGDEDTESSSGTSSGNSYEGNNNIDDDVSKIASQTASNTKSDSNAGIGAINGDGTPRTPEQGTEESFPGGDIVLSRRMFGVPYQFRDNVDPRASDHDKELGLDFMSMVAEAPYISILPGQPLFLPDVDDDKKGKYLESLNEEFESVGRAVENFGKLIFESGTKLDEKDLEIRYFGFQSAYEEYMQYVNTLCWMLAINMGLSDSLSIPGFSGEPAKAGRFDWKLYRLANVFGRASSTDVDALDGTVELVEGAQEAWRKGTTAKDSVVELWTYFEEKASREAYYTDYYINPSISYSESLSNQTSPSMMEGVVQGASDYAKELAFLLNAGIDAANANQSQEAMANMVKELGAKITGNKGVLGKLINGATTILSGANILFPEIWKSSSFDRSYNVEINFKTPYGTKEAIYLDIMVPLAHLLCLAAPRQQSINTYKAPFLVKCFIPGFCSVDMGIVESMSISKGGDGSAWSVDGYPLEVTVQMNIKDLYQNLSIARINTVSPTDVYHFIWNTGFMDYVAVLGGINMKATEAARRSEYLMAIAQNNLNPEYVERRAVDLVAESIRNSIMRIRKGF